MSSLQAAAITMGLVNQIGQDAAYVFGPLLLRE
jgi:hypothetical protein